MHSVPLFEATFGNWMKGWKNRGWKFDSGVVLGEQIALGGSTSSQFIADMSQTASPSMKVGVLALQGAFQEHVNAFERCGIASILIKKPAQLDQVDGLVLPGGESTTMGLLLSENGLMEPLREWVACGRPIWGTCAGLILLADTIENPKKDGQSNIGGLKVTVRRNAFGTQRDSFSADLRLSFFSPSDPPMSAVFIRAPVITQVSPPVDIIASLPGATPSDSTVVAVRQGWLLGSSFHPELTPDSRLHSYFGDMVKAFRSQGNVSLS